ncbi:radical SAM protein [Acetivibrio straminisolvens]|jgi:MoaA/NifB/PqqE/SkfB family radical SAM enzyme|nr:radical SAM protein [Acetivibrio straminisolvens]
MPKAVSLEVTTSCPLNCSYCYRKKDANSTMTFEKFLELKERLVKIPELSRITFCGIGEALLCKDFYEIIHNLKEYRISVVTSGMILIDYEKLNKFKNVDLLIFSIDATTESLMKKICGEAYNFKNLIKNLEELKSYNKKMRFEGVCINSVMNCTINEHNIEEMPKLIDMAAEHKFVSVHYSLPWGREQFVRDNMEKLKQNFALARLKAKKYHIFVEDLFDSYCCVMLDRILSYINIKGEVFPCGYALYKNYKIGNIFSENVEDMWNSKENQDFKLGNFCRECSLIKMNEISREGEVMYE